jgi:thymidylate kinase
MKLIYLIGLPGCGKSTVMKEFMKRIAPSSDWVVERPAELLDSHYFNGIRILGKYEEGETFSGTDRLSMAVAPKAIEYFKTAQDKLVVGEGDRLNNSGFFNTFDDKVIIHLTVSDEERLRRYKERGSDQSDKFIQTVRTKVKNIVEEFGDKQTLFGEEEGSIVEIQHQTPEDTIKVVDFMLTHVV